jgi:DHA1 family multidrug resistance protein-like MFS transporter
MRESQDTDRTEVPTRASSPEGINTPEHMATLTEKNTNATNSEHHRQQFDDEFDNSYDFPAQEGETVNNSSAEDLGERDLEKADEEANKKKAQLPRNNSQKKKDPNLIEWDGPDDPENPMNWPVTKKWIVTVALGLMTFCVTFASSVFSNATMPTAELFGVSSEVTTLGTSLFVLGFAVGPLVGVRSLLW